MPENSSYSIYKPHGQQNHSPYHNYQFYPQKKPQSLESTLSKNNPYLWSNNNQQVPSYNFSYGQNLSLSHYHHGQKEGKRGNMENMQNAQNPMKKKPSPHILQNTEAPPTKIYINYMSSLQNQERNHHIGGGSSEEQQKMLWLRQREMESKREREKLLSKGQQKKEILDRNNSKPKGPQKSHIVFLSDNENQTTKDDHRRRVSFSERKKRRLKIFNDEQPKQSSIKRSRNNRGASSDNFASSSTGQFTVPFIPPQRQRQSIIIKNEPNSNKEVQALKNQILFIKSQMQQILQETQKINNFQQQQQQQQKGHQMHNSSNATNERPHGNISQSVSPNNISNQYQFSRTKRLQQLNEQNQNLYNELVWKLKHVAQEEYEGYLEQVNMSRSFLNEIFQHYGEGEESRKRMSKSNSKVKSRSGSGSKYYNRLHRENQMKFLETEENNAHKPFSSTANNPIKVTDFIDNGAFEEEYQRRYTQTKNTPEKIYNLKESQPKQIEEILQQQPLSPFSIKENQSQPQDCSSQSNFFTKKKNSNQSYPNIISYNSPHKQLKIVDESESEGGKMQQEVQMDDEGYKGSFQVERQGGSLTDKHNRNKQSYTFNKKSEGGIDGAQRRMTAVEGQFQKKKRGYMSRPFEQGQKMAKQELKRAALRQESRRQSVANSNKKNEAKNQQQKQYHHLFGKNIINEHENQPQRKQINDFNRTIEEKLIRKRIQSEYQYFHGRDNINSRKGII